jgi:hypothetical protein
MSDDPQSRHPQSGRIGGRLDGMVQLGSNRVAGFELQELIDWIDSTGTTEIESPLPAPDVTHPRSSWVWDFYSPERLIEFEARSTAARARRTTRPSPTPSPASAGRCRARHSTPSASSSSWNTTQTGSATGLPDSLLRVPMPLIPQLAPAGPGVIWATTERAVISQAPNGSSDDGERHDLAGRPEPGAVERPRLVGFGR